MLSADGKERFPRYKSSKNGHVALASGFRENYGHGRKLKEYKEKVASGKLPRGWDRLDKKKKSLARKVARGMSVADACKLLHMESSNFYLWRECHPLFRRYFEKCAMKYAGLVNMRIDGNLPQAVRVVEQSLQSRDMYHAHEAAVQLLKGRGIYKPTTNVQGEVTNRTILEGTVNVKHSHKHDKEVVTMLMDFLKAKAQGEGTKKIKPKIIDMGVLKTLPPAQESDVQVQDSRPKETVAKD